MVAPVCCSRLLFGLLQGRDIICIIGLNSVEKTRSEHCFDNSTGLESFVAYLFLIIIVVAHIRHALSALAHLSHQALDVKSTGSTHAAHTWHAAHATHTGHASHASHASHTGHASHASHASHIGSGFWLIILIILILPASEISLHKVRLRSLGETGPPVVTLGLDQREENITGGCVGR